MVTLTMVSVTNTRLKMDKTEVILQYISQDKTIGICDAIEEIYPELDIESKIALLDTIEDMVSMTYKTKVIH